MNNTSAVLDWQDEDYVKLALQSHEQLKADRAPWEDLYRQVERRVDPVQAGGFNMMTPGGARGLDMFDSTAAEGLERFEAAIGGLRYPRGQRYLTLTTTSAELNRMPEVQRWLAYATDRIFAMRYAPAAGFETQIYEDIRSAGLYGTSPFWVDEMVGYSMFYKAFHLSEVYIGENYCGRVDTAHREFTKTARQLKQEFPNGLSEKMQKALDENKPDTKFRIVQILRPHDGVQPGKMDWRGKPVESMSIAVDEKWIMRRSGYFTMPLLVSRTSTSPRDVYGRSPAMRVLGTIKGLNETAKTILRAAHRAVDPPILFHDDGQISKFSTRPGGLNPGMVDESGRILAHALQTGGELPIGLEYQASEREVVKTAFLDKFFSLLMERGDRMTATEALEVTRQSGMLVAPTAGRMETEKDGPMVARELDVGLRSGQILPPPAVMREAARAGQASIKTIYDNPLSRMARSEEVQGFARWTQMLTEMAPFDEDVIDLVDADEAGRGSAEALGVNPRWVATPDQVAAKRQARQQAKQTQTLIEGAPAAASAALDLARARQVEGGQ